MELAKWALQVAASQLRSKGASRKEDSLSGEKIEESKQKVMLVWEHPRDPESYMPQSRRPSNGWASWWAFPEWARFSNMYGVYQAKFDQGKLGHVRPKPTEVATTSWYLFESLHCQCLTPEERAMLGSGPRTTPERLRVSASWAR